jgi:acyl-CoA synthetase (AMP-forming)/AMP-acid ligase II
MSLNLATLLRESAKANPTKPAIHIGDVTLPYAMVDGLAQKFAGALRALGLKPGQHVALMLPNVPQFTIAYFGCHYAGNPVVPLNVLLTADEIAYHLDDSDAVAVVAWEGFLEQAQHGFARVASCKHLIVAKADRADLSARRARSTSRRSPARRRRSPTCTRRRPTTRRSSSTPRARPASPRAPSCRTSTCSSTRSG